MSKILQSIKNLINKTPTKREIIGTPRRRGGTQTIGGAIFIMSVCVGGAFLVSQKMLNMRFKKEEEIFKRKEKGLFFCENSFREKSKRQNLYRRMKRKKMKKKKLLRKLRNSKINGKKVMI